MRTSGAHQDAALYAVPIVVLIVLAVSRFGGLEQTARLVNDTVIGAISWVMSAL